MNNRICSVCSMKLGKQRVYCCRSCQAIGLSKRIGPKLEKDCLFCRTAFIVPVYLQKREFCSRVCKDEHQKYIPGRRLGQKQSENEIERRKKSVIKAYQNAEMRQRHLNSLYEVELRLGYWSGSDQASRAKSRKTFFERTGYTHPFSDPFVREKCEKTCIKRYGMLSHEFARAEQNRSDTRPELMIEKILSQLQIGFQHPFIVKKFEFDFYLQDYELFIEVDGDYWHGNSNFYNRLDVSQTNSVLNDIKKEDVCDELGINLFRIWESEIDLFEERLNEEISN